MELLESRQLLTADFGDAPDRGRNTAVNDYQTLAYNNGPKHVIDTTINTLFIGRTVDGETGSYQGLDAGLDDRSGTTANINKGVDDEDGIENSSDLEATVGSHPAISVRVTNLTQLSATLYGWLDANRNGAFDTTTERVSVTVPSGTNGTQVTLKFPQLQLNSVGTTFLRLRLSSDPAAANSTGTAVGGEIEDHRFIVRPQLRNTIRGLSLTGIGDRYNGGPDINDRDLFGWVVTPIGDVNADGVNDLAVSAPFDGPAKSQKGAVYILFMTTTGRARYSVKIGHKMNGGPELRNEDHFGVGVTSLGDMDGDGITELAVTAADDDTGGSNRGAIYVVWLNKSGVAKKITKLASGTSGMPQLQDGESLESLAAVGDIDGDGIVDLAVGSPLAKQDGKATGKVRLLFLNANGTVKRSAEFFNQIAGQGNLSFGTEVVWLGDLNRDGTSELAVVSGNSVAESPYAMVVDVISLNSDGTVQSAKRSIDNSKSFWTRKLRGLSSVGDINGDGIRDIAFTQENQLSVATLNADGTIQSTVQHDEDPQGNLDMYAELDFFGGATANLGDLNGDGSHEFVVGVPAAIVDPSRNTIFGGVLVASLKGVVPNKVKPSIPALTIEKYAVDVLNWPVIDEAQSYELYIQNLTTKQIVATALTQSKASFVPPSDWSIGLYAVKVRAKNEFGVSAWSKTQTVAHRPKPVLVSVLSDMIERRPTIKWQPVNGAVKYTIRMDGSMSFSGEPVFTLDSTVTQFTHPSDLTADDYHVVLTAYGQDGTTSTFYSDRFTVGGPSRITVKNLMLNPRPIITWSAMSDATHYEIEILSYGVTVVTTTSTTASFQPDEALKGGTYTFRVRGVNKQGQTAEWAAKSFSIQHPPSIRWNADYKTFTWDGSALAEKFETRVEYPGDTPGTTVIQTKEILNPDYLEDRLRVPVEKLATIKMSVREIGFDGEKGNWSPVTFGVINSFPGYQLKVDHDPQAKLFTWQPIPGAEKYQVEIFTTEYYAKRVFNTYVTDPKFQLTDTLPKGEFVARVRAFGYDGTEGYVGASQKFTVLEPPKVLDGPSLTTRTLTWTPLPGVVSYNVVIRDYYYRTDVFSIKLINEARVTTPQFQSRGSFYAMFQGVKADGSLTEWSDAAVFYT